MNTYKVTFSTLYGSFFEILLILKKMKAWCYANTGDCICNISIDDTTPITNEIIEKLIDSWIAIKSKPTFSFEEELDALAFRLMFSEYL